MMSIRVIPNHTILTAVNTAIIYLPLTRVFHSLDHWPVHFTHCVCFQVINTRICSRKHSGFLESPRDRRIMALGGFVNRSQDVRWHFLCALLWNVPSSVKWRIRAVDLNPMRRVIWRIAKCSLKPWILRCKSMKTYVFFLGQSSRERSWPLTRVDHTTSRVQKRNVCPPDTDKIQNLLLRHVPEDRSPTNIEVSL